MHYLMKKKNPYWIRNEFVCVVCVYALHSKIILSTKKERQDSDNEQISHHHISMVFKSQTILTIRIIIIILIIKN